MSINFLRHSGR